MKYPPLLDLIPGELIVCDGRIMVWLGTAQGTKGCRKASKLEKESYARNVRKEAT